MRYKPNLTRNQPETNQPNRSAATPATRGVEGNMVVAKNERRII
jgi:hypothetical protein